MLCFDPGEKIGFAKIHDDNRKVVLDDFGNVKYEDFKQWLGLHQEWFARADAIVIEQYRVLPGKAKAHAGSKLETARAIGNIELLASFHNVKVQFSDASNNVNNLKMSGMGHVLKQSHANTHWCYAFAHGYAFLVRLGLTSHAKTRP